MILLWPLTLAVAAGVSWQRRSTETGRGLAPWLGWAAAGFLMSFSLVTGFSIGLFILPLAAVATLGMAYLSPHRVEMSGFLAGVGATALMVAALATTS